MDGNFKNTKFVIVCFQSEIGFGKMETYIKLEKLGEVSRYVLQKYKTPFFLVHYPNSTISSQFLPA